jgi:hypothetical protein
MDGPGYHEPYRRRETSSNPVSKNEKGTTYLSVERSPPKWGEVGSTNGPTPPHAAFNELLLPGRAQGHHRPGELASMRSKQFWP